VTIRHSKTAPRRRAHRSRPRRSPSPSTASDTRACRRYAGLRASGQRCSSGRPLVQVSPPARHRHRRLGRAECAGRRRSRETARDQTPNLPRHRSSCTRGWRRSARTAGRRCPSTSARSTTSLSPLFCGRLLLQDLHVAEELLEQGLRALHPPPPVSARRRRSRIPTYASTLCPLRRAGAGGGPAGLAAALRPRAAVPASSSPTSRRSSAAACCMSAVLKSTASRRPTG
jgi:hypothetical protein